MADTPGLTSLPPGGPIFTQAKLQRIIDQLPTDMAPGEKVVVATVDSAGVGAVASFKLTDGMTLLGAAHYDLGAESLKDGLEAKVLLRWR